MVILTLIARAKDGLPLATSTEGDEQHDYNMVKYTNQAKMLFRKLNATSPPKCTLETESGSYVFHYIIEQDVCYLCLCDKNYPSKLAYKFLADVQQEFAGQYANRVHTVTRPYHFIEFDSYIQTARRRYGDNRARYNLSAVSNELQDVQRVMVQNIEDVIHRGEALNSECHARLPYDAYHARLPLDVAVLDDKASNLAEVSKKYRADARYLNMKSLYTKLAIGFVFLVMLLLYARYRLF